MSNGWDIPPVAGDPTCDPTSSETEEPTDDWPMAGDENDPEPDCIAAVPSEDRPVEPGVWEV